MQTKLTASASKIPSVSPGEFTSSDHWYPRALNAQIHPLVSYFFNMSNQRIAERYTYRNPQVKIEDLLEFFNYKPKYFKWAGSDLMHATNHRGRDQMVVIETNSCPSGQKSFPLLDENQDQGGYYTMLKEVFLPQIPAKSKGRVAVIFDKNPMEVEGYAKVLADLLKEEVFVVDLHELPATIVKNHDDYLWLDTAEGEVKLRAVFRYVTQKPWMVFPPISKTVMLNPIICCLAGGRNKLMAAKAYDFFNADLEGTGLKITFPETIWDVQKNELRLWMERFSYRAVIKVPYGNAGQGISTITSQDQFNAFMENEYYYDQFIVQQLVGHPFHDQEGNAANVLHQVGTMPTKNSDIFVFDLRLAIGSTKNGFRPLAANSRRAAVPLTVKQTNTGSFGKNNFSSESPEMLMTNLSFKTKDGNWGTDDSRLLLMDRRDFNKLGLGLDDLIDGYIQTVLAVIAIDTMAKRLLSTKRTLKKRLFQSLNDDSILHQEIWPEKLEEVA